MMDKREECVGCGFCCIKSPCMTSKRIYGNGIRECPELEWDGKRYICKLCFEDILGEIYREELFIGTGCSSNLNSWRKEIIPRREKDNPTNGFKNLDPIFQKFLFCLGKNFISRDIIYLMLNDFSRILQEDGKTEEETKHITKMIMKILNEQRSSFVEDFMG